MIDIQNATHQQLLAEYEKCQRLWSDYQYDCFGFYISALHKRITELGGWPVK